MTLDDMHVCLTTVAGPCFATSIYTRRPDKAVLMVERDISHKSQAPPHRNSTLTLPTTSSTDPLRSNQSVQLHWVHDSHPICVAQRRKQLTLLYPFTLASPRKTFVPLPDQLNHLASHSISHIRIGPRKGVRPTRPFELCQPVKKRGRAVFQSRALVCSYGWYEAGG